MVKFSMIKLANKIRKTFKDSEKAKMISTGAEMIMPTEDSDFVVMPKWWQQISGVKGLPFGFAFMISGKPDSGKTSATIEAMRCAQAQGVYVILVDTEKKTTKRRLTSWGVEPEEIARVQPRYLEEAYDGIDKWIEVIKDADEDARILVIFDSLGNTPAFKEAESSVEDTQQLVIAAKVNKRGLRRLAPRLGKDKIHLLIINQTYKNLGSPGSSNAGGKAADFFTGLTFQTSRKAWLEKTKDGKKIRVGARVQWTTYKNHLLDEKAIIGKVAVLDITAKGIEVKE